MSSELRASLPSTAGIEDEATRSVLSRLIDVLNVRRVTPVTASSATSRWLTCGAWACRSHPSRAGPRHRKPPARHRKRAQRTGIVARHRHPRHSGPLRDRQTISCSGSPVTALAGKGGQIADIRKHHQYQVLLSRRSATRFSHRSMVSASPSGRMRKRWLTSTDGANGQYYVKIDNQATSPDSGFSVTARNGPPVSEFYVRADRFAIGSPWCNARWQNEDGTWPPAPQDEIPFIVPTTPTIIEGKTVQPGVT